MPKLIKDGELVDDHWQVVESESELPTAQIAGDQRLLLPMAMWLQHSNAVAGKPNVGLWLDSDQAPDPIADICQSLPVIGIRFPVFSDGRGYSYARQIREYYGFTGELRAIGDILPDQLFFYQRCGFNAFALRSDVSTEHIQKHLDDFTVVYQAAGDKLKPAILKR